MSCNNWYTVLWCYVCYAIKGWIIAGAPRPAFILLCQWTLNLGVTGPCSSSYVGFHVLWEWFEMSACVCVCWCLLWQCWLDREKPILKQLPRRKLDLRFVVKFYTPDPGMLEDELTRYCVRFVASSRQIADVFNFAWNFTLKLSLFCHGLLLRLVTHSRETCSLVQVSCVRFWCKFLYKKLLQQVLLSSQIF